MNHGWKLLAVLACLLSPVQAQDSSPEPTDDVLLVVTFSGGGTRAAAFGYGVALALRERAVAGRSLLERVDRVAGVSGGSFVAAQLALDPSQEGLERFQSEMLFADLESKLVKTAARRTLKLARGDYNRSDAAAECYGGIFQGASFATTRGAPELWVQTTDLLGGRPLVFRASALRHMGLSPAQVTLGQAVAASAAFPGALPPLNLQIAGHRPSECPEEGCRPGQDPKAALPLADGGIADNLGLEVLFQGELPPETRAVVVVVVNSRRDLAAPWKLDDSGIVSAGYTVALQQRLMDRLVLQRAEERLRVLELEAQVAGQELLTELVVVDFSGSKRKKELDQVGTRFDLKEEQVKLLIAEGRAQARPLLDRVVPLWQRASEADARTR